MALSGSLSHLHSLVSDAISHGATVLLGSNGQPDNYDTNTSAATLFNNLGKTVDDKHVKSESGMNVPVKSRFFPPTLIINCTHKMRIAKEEAFGPIVAIYKVKSLEEAIRKVNDSQFGLTASIYTNDLQQAKTFAEGVDTGMVFLNRNDYVDPYLTWSGRKMSGKGDGVGLQAFHNVTKLKGIHFKMNKTDL